MGGVTKTLSKGFKSFHKYSLGARAHRALVGDKIYKKEHFLSYGTINAADKMVQAEKDAKNAEDAAEALRKRQAADLAALDDEENRRIKKLLTASRGTRSYRGAPMFRGRASNTAGAPRTAAGGASAAPSAGALRSGGARGGLSRTGSNYRSLLP